MRRLKLTPLFFFIPFRSTTNQSLSLFLTFPKTQIFTNDPNTYISITCHSGVIESFLFLFQKKEWKVPPGGLIPFVVEGTRIP